MVVLVEVAAAVAAVWFEVEQRPCVMCSIRVRMFFVGGVWHSFE